ncbi:MAG: hypothetical protein ACRCZ1_07300 [Cetobacterium sp.]
MKNLFDLKNDLKVQLVINNNIIIVLKTDLQKVLDYCNLHSIECRIKTVKSF